LLVDDVAAVQFNGPIVEFTSADPRQAPEIRRLGPDALSDDFVLEEARRCFGDRGSSNLADLLLDQSFVAGIGNKYKSELLLVLGLNPFRPDRLDLGDRTRTAARSDSARAPARIPDGQHARSRQPSSAGSRCTALGVPAARASVPSMRNRRV